MKEFSINRNTHCGRLTVGILGLIAFFTSVTLAWSAPDEPQSASGALLWQDQTRLATTEVSRFVATHHDRVAVFGDQVVLPCGTPRCRDTELRLYDVNTGALLWRAIFDLGQTTDTAAGVAIEGNVVVTVTDSFGEETTGGRDWWVVAGYDLSSGTLLWQNVL